MKKLGSLLLVLLLVLALTACDSIPKDNGGSSGGETSGNTDTSGDTSDNTDTSADTSDSTSGSKDVYAEDGLGEGRIGDLVHTYFFDFTVNSAYTTTDYNGYTATQEGYQLLVVNTTVKNTFSSSITMWDSDFQAQWTASATTEEYSWPITDDGNVPTVSDNQLPAEYELAVDEERTGEIVFEVPADEKDFSVSTLEIFDDGSETGEEGDTYVVFFTATAQ